MQYDVVVVGGGFGGLSTALALTQKGARVALSEALAYPGGCASTFTRGGAKFEAGATLFSGFGEEQLWGRWIRELGLGVTIDFIDPVVVHLTPTRRIEVWRDRKRLLEDLSAMEGAPREALARFFAMQAQVADVLWGLFDNPEELPPQSASGLLWHARRLREYAQLLGLVGKTLMSVLARFGLDRFTPLVTYLDSLCQITVQCPAHEAEATFALAAMDYYYRGTGHVRGGIGKLASAMVEAIERGGGDVFLASSVRSVRRSRGGFVVDTRRGELRARTVVLNVLPQSALCLAHLGATASARMTRLSRRVEGGWGAAMLYLVAQPPADAGPDAHHFDLVLDERQPLVEGNHSFVSISSAHDGVRAPSGARTITVSTHVPLAEVLALPGEEQRARMSDTHDRMKRCVAELLPTWWSGVERTMTASPRTFARFTMRPHGYVGGIPRRVGLANYKGLGPLEIERDLYLVGDTAFPGQSTLATSVGGVRLAAHIASGGRLDGTFAAEARALHEPPKVRGQRLDSRAPSA